MTAQVHSMPEPFVRALGDEVRTLMARHGINQTQMAQLLGISQPGVSMRLRGLTAFNVNELAMVARFFRIRVSDLVANAEGPRPEEPDRGLLPNNTDSAHPERLELPTFCVGNGPADDHDAVVIPFPAQPFITTQAVNLSGNPCAVTNLASA